jgi:hypothetical protein
MCPYRLARRAGNTAEPAREYLVPAGPLPLRRF